MLYEQDIFKDIKMDVLRGIFSAHPRHFFKTNKILTNMGICIKCGNDYDKSFEVVMYGKTYVFDSFECAISELAPRCKHCGCVIIGHGVEDEQTVYCCANCAHEEGVTEVFDRT